MTIITAAEVTNSINSNTNTTDRKRRFNALVEEELKKIKDDPFHRFEIYLPFDTFGNEEADIQFVIDAGYRHRYEKYLRCWGITIES